MSVRYLVSVAVVFVMPCASLHAAALSLRYDGLAPSGDLQWAVLLQPDAAPETVAVEIGFEFVGGRIVDLQPNAIVFDDLNPGQNPFSGTVSIGTSIHDNGGPANAAFASLGGVIANLGETLVLTILTDSTGLLSLGGHNHNGYFTGARVWQTGLLQDGLTASLQVVPRDADFDANGTVNGRDFLAWQRNFGAGPGATQADGDANGDGFVDGIDLGAWEEQFGATANLPVAYAVPEPQSVALALAAALAIVGCATSGQRI